MSLPYPVPANTGQWAQDELYELGDPETATNIGYIEAWEHDESPSGFGYNPLGDETGATGSVHAPGNSASVQAYDSWLSGLKTTAYNLTSLQGNAGIVAALKTGDSTLAEFSTAQSEGGWSGGLEPEIKALGSSTPFSYGGASGLVQGAPGVASVPADTAPGSRGVTGDIWYTITHPFQTGKQAGTAVENTIGPGAQLKAAESGVLGPLVKLIAGGAADVGFIGFGMLLIIVGLIVTFKGGSGDAAPSPSGGVVETGSKVKEVAEVAAA